MIRFFFILVIAIVLPFRVVAADNGMAQVIMSPGDILHGHFVEERHLKGFNGPMKSEGRFTVAPQHGLIWSVEKPFPTVTIITPAGLAQLINGATVLNLSSQKIPFMLHLYDILGGALAGNWGALETDFSVTRGDDLQNWQVTLVPHDIDNPTMPFSSITVRGHRFVETVVMLKADGDSDTLTFLQENVSSAALTASEERAFSAVHP